jgi:hypothetical protein
MVVNMLHSCIGNISRLSVLCFGIGLTKTKTLDSFQMELNFGRHDVSSLQTLIEKQVVKQMFKSNKLIFKAKLGC